MGNFNFVGKVVMPNDVEKFYNKATSKKDGKDYWAWNRVSFMLKGGDSSAFVELGGGHFADTSKAKIYSYGLENNKLEISWADRNKEEILGLVADFKKIKVNFDSEQEFISEFDAVEYLESVIPMIEKDKLIYVSGNIKYEPYNGKFTPKFTISRIGYAKEDAIPKFEINMEVFYSKDSYDDSRLEEEKVIELMGYVEQYINKEEGKKYIPQKLTFNCRKIDFNNEAHVKQFDYFKRFMQTKSKNYVKMAYKINYVRGAEEVEFTEDMLTNTQKEQIIMGMATFEDFKPRVNFGGNSIVEFRIVKPNLASKGYENGVIDTEIKIDEFESNIYKIVPKFENLTESKVEKTDEIEDLFK